MISDWLSRIFKQEQPVSPSTSSEQPQPSGLQTALTLYRQALTQWQPQDRHSFLTVLLARDKVEALRHKEKGGSAAIIGQLTALDQQLRQQAPQVPVELLSNWRQTVQPATNHWWWYLDKAAAETAQEKSFLWHSLAVTFFILTVPLASDIIRRLWAHAPDNIAIVSTLLTLLITASPFTKNGRELMQWLLHRVSFLPTHRHAETMATTAFIAFLLIAGLRFLYLPQLASRYNEQGVAAINDGQLTLARQKLQQAIAINSDLAPSYYNLAAAYETIARYDEAIQWYEQALEQDLEFAPAYNNLGRLHLLQGDPVQAQTILERGLFVLQRQPDTIVDEPAQQPEQLVQYRLHTHLGQALYEQGDYAQADRQLRDALALEPGLELGFLSARPHYYLALTYEAQQRPPAEIIPHWEAALSYVTNDDPAPWPAIIRERLRELRAGVP